MSYNIMGKNASFKGDISGTIENQVNDWDNQSISGNKTFTAAITSSADVMLSGSGKVSASFFYGDGSGLSGVAAAAGLNREVQFNNGGSALGASSNFTFTSADQLQVTGQISASLGVTGSEFHGDGSNLTAVTASFVTASNIVGILDASQINIGDGLEDNSDKIRVKLISNSGLGRAASGMQLDVYGLSNGSYSDASTIALGVSSGNTTKITLSALENNLNISGSKLVGDQSIANARLQNTVSVVNVTASGHMSASTFHGDGSALTGVSATATPAGSNTDIQFNADGVLGSSNRIQFNTGSFTLTATNLSSSGNISGSSLYLQDEIIAGGQTFLDINGNVTAGNGSFAEITASSTISSSADVYGANFRGNGSTLNNVPLGTYANSNIVFCDSTANTITSNSSLQWTGTQLTSTGLSASADLQVGGHITGSGDAVIGGTIYWDRTGTGTGTGPKLTPGGSPANSLNIDGDSIVTIQADTNVRFRVGDASTPDLILDITPTVVSSSVPITGSAIHTNGGITMPGGGGDFTFLSVDGNVTAGSIEMLAGGSDVLNFNDNSISGSGNISGSAFYGDGSNLTGISTSTYYYLHNPDFSLSNDTVSNYMSLSGFGNKGGGSREPFFIAPASGSIARVLVSTALNAATGSTTAIGEGNTYVFYYNVNTVEGTSGTPTGLVPTAHVTSSAANLQSTNYRYGGGGGAGSLTEEKRFKLIIDLENNNPTVSGSNSFDPGDVLIFGMHANDAGSVANNQQVTVVLKLTEPYTYP